MENETEPEQVRPGSRQSAKVTIILILVLAVFAAIHFKSKNKTTGDADDARSPSSESGLPRLVDLGAEKCIPCKMMAPILDELRDEYEGTLNVTFIDVKKNPNAIQEYEIDLIPTQIFYDASGNELFRHVGFFSKEEILDKWRELGVELSRQDNQ
jgi:thioredoxin 1